MAMAPHFPHVEALCVSKDKSGRVLPDDVVVYQQGRLYGVFDGATSLSGQTIGGLSTGRFAALQCAQAAQHFVLTRPPSEFSCLQLLQSMGSHLSAALRAKAVAGVQAATTAALALDAGDTLHFLLVGDSGVRINGSEQVQVHKTVDAIFTAARVALFKRAMASPSVAPDDWISLELRTRQTIAHGMGGALSEEVLQHLSCTVSDQLRHLLAPDAVEQIPTLLAQGISKGQPPYMNRPDHSLGYAVLDGNRVQGPDLLVFSRPRAEVDSLEFFTDGYMATGAEPTVASWEAAWLAVETEDPFKIGPFAHIKCSTPHDHWDDRTVLIVRS
jgi:hypothetical protein